MANYLFEQMTDAQAAAYDPADDNLFFLTGSPGTIGVQVNPASGFMNASITLTNGTVSHTFGADALAGEDLTFFSNSNNTDTLAFGEDSSGDTATVTGVAGSGARFYGLGGDDTIGGGNANDVIFGGEGDDRITGLSSTLTGGKYVEADFLMGGNGADTIVGGLGNDHIYGNEMTSVQGSVDGGDSISAGAGNDYVNGNAGNDTILGEDGNDRLYGGAGTDSILGGNGNDYLQGNKGADTLVGGDGVDQLRGGADGDSLVGGEGGDLLNGDAGADTISGGNGYDYLSGGADADRFTFAVGEASDANLRSLATATDHGLTDEIVDFTNGSDKIALGFTVTEILHTATGVTFTDSTAAQVYAQQLLDNHTGAGEIAAITVGSSTYLFYNDAGVDTTAANSAIKVDGVADTVFNLGTGSDFV